MISRKQAVHDALVGQLIARITAGVDIQRMVGEEFYELDIRTGEEDEGNWQRIPTVLIEQSHVNAALRGHALIGTGSVEQFAAATRWDPRSSKKT